MQKSIILATAAAALLSPVLVLGESWQCSCDSCTPFDSSDCTALNTACSDNDGAPADTCNAGDTSYTCETADGECSNDDAECTAYCDTYGCETTYNCDDDSDDNGNAFSCACSSCAMTSGTCSDAETFCVDQAEGVASACQAGDTTWSCSGTGCTADNVGDCTDICTSISCSESSFSCDDGGDDDDGCFAGSETVLMECGATKVISSVEVGDVIQVVSADGSLTFSEVVFLPHGANTQKATFAELELTSSNSLRATPMHYVLAGACGADAFELTAMKDIAEGSCVQTANGEDEVTSNSLVVDHGIYTVVTKESTGMVVVNGVRASSFAHNHWLVNNYYNIHRTLYEVAPSLMKNRDVIAVNLIVGDIAISL
jgi:hypothetical protein